MKLRRVVRAELLSHPNAPEVLAARIFQSKETTPEEADLRDLAAGITNEFDRRPVMVPEKLVALNDCQMVSSLVTRWHLPRRRITGRLFPMLTPGGMTEAAMILPCKFWDLELVQMHRV